MDNQLRDVRDWAKSKIASGQEPPWAWYQYMKLIEAADTILAGMDCITPKENLQQLEQRPGTYLRLVGATYLPDNVPLRPETETIPLPM